MESWYVLWLPKRRCRNVRLHEGSAKSVSTAKSIQSWPRRLNTPRRNCGGAWTPQSEKKLLRLLDAQNALLVESKLISFTAGVKLAWGMAKELEADGLYSFELEEEEHICHPAEQDS